MQSVSETYQRLYKDPNHSKEVKLTVDGVEYGEGDIWNLQTTGDLYASNVPAIGGCVSREGDLSISPKGTIPRMAEIQIFVRLVLRNASTDEVEEASEWLPKGVLYIDTRSCTYYGTLIIHAYDAMMKAEQPFLAEGDPGEWPRPVPAVVQEIAQRLGVGIDSRTVLNENYMVSYPNDYTMREILGHIAVAHVGNWIMTDSGDLRLVGLTEIPAESNHLVTEEGDAISFGGVLICV